MEAARLVFLELFQQSFRIRTRPGSKGITLGNLKNFKGKKQNFGPKNLLIEKNVWSKHFGKKNSGWKKMQN